MANALAIPETGRIESLCRSLGWTKHADPFAVRSLIHSLRPLNCGKTLIRIGASGDGGYLVPDDLEGIKYCFSPGVSNVIDFEDQLANRGVISFLADYSVNDLPHSRPELILEKKFIGIRNAEEFITLEAWKTKYLPGYSDDLLLQMDIEGSEYEVFLNLPETLLNQFRIMVVEFHFLDRIFDKKYFPIISYTFARILQFFHVSHIHPNNIGGSVTKHGIEIPKILEFTFLNKRRVTVTSAQKAFPHKLDADNGRARTLTLPPCWYS